ncbi:MAG: SRPBCC family protein [Mycobacteriaceae bacterium]|nr:SRPBCC family protein [Mycobacteriaceae bacterium]
MTVTETREVVIEASPEQIFDVIADIEALPDWSSAHRSVELVEVGDDGRPAVAKMVVNTGGNVDEQVIAYTWSDNSVSWTLVSSSKLRTQEGCYTVTPQGDRSLLKFELTVDPAIPVPGFLLKRILKGSMQTATDGLRKHVLKVIGG